MTIITYSTFINSITIPFILRGDDAEVIGAKVRNQETKESIDVLVGAGTVVSSDSFKVSVADILTGINENTTFSVELYDGDGNPLYRDIVVFDERLDTESDYEQNDEDNEYVFA